MDAQTISSTIEKFRANPEAGRSSPAVTGRLVEGRAELAAGSYTWYADLAPAVGGTNSAPSPTAYLLGALAGCAVAFVHDTLGPQFGVRIEDVTAIARCSSNAAGLLGLEGTTADLTDLELEVTITSPDPQDKVDQVVDAWRERCPIFLAITKANPVSTKFSVATGAAGAR